MRWSEICPPIMDDRMRAICGKEEIRPFYNDVKAEVTQEAIQCLQKQLKLILILKQYQRFLIYKTIFIFLFVKSQVRLLKHHCLSEKNTETLKSTRNISLERLIVALTS
jgi:hypothetical protein